MAGKAAIALWIETLRGVSIRFFYDRFCGLSLLLSPNFTKPSSVGQQCPSRVRDSAFTVEPSSYRSARLAAAVCGWLHSQPEVKPGLVLAQVAYAEHRLYIVSGRWRPLRGR